jgi:hypothetical protein
MFATKVYERHYQVLHQEALLFLTRTKLEKHAGDVPLNNSFDQAWERLNKGGELPLKTEHGTPFIARAGVAESKLYPNERCIIFLQYSRKDGKLKDYARCYQCCWENYCNCSGTIIGTYCEALDASI